MTSYSDATCREVMGAVRQALDAGERDGGNGGVHHDAVAQYGPVSETRTKKYLQELERRGMLESVYGFDDTLKSPRKSWLPVYHPDVAENDPTPERGRK